MQEKQCSVNLLQTKSNIPPLKYDYVYKLKQDFKDLEIIINGGITSTEQVKNHLDKVDGYDWKICLHSPYL